MGLSNFPAVENLEFEVLWVFGKKDKRIFILVVKSIDGNPVLGLLYKDSLVDWDVTQQDVWVGWRRSKSAIANRYLSVYRTSYDTVLLFIAYSRYGCRFCFWLRRMTETNSQWYVFLALVN